MCLRDTLAEHAIQQRLQRAQKSIKLQTANDGAARTNASTVGDGAASTVGDGAGPPHEGQAVAYRKATLRAPPPSRSGRAVSASSHTSSQRASETAGAAAAAAPAAGRVLVRGTQGVVYVAPLPEDRLPKIQSSGFFMSGTLSLLKDKKVREGGKERLCMRSRT